MMKTSTRFLRPTLTTACLLILGFSAAHAANIWDGGSTVDSNWDTKENWDNDLVPSFPVDLTFDGTERLAPFNNMGTTVQVNGFTFGATAGSFGISGNAITLGGNILNQNTNTQTINLDMGLVGTTTRTITLSGGTVVLNGNISGGGALSLLLTNDTGTATLNGNNSYSGGTTLTGSTNSNKTLNLGHANALGSGTFVWSPGNTAVSYLDNTSGSAMTVANPVTLSGAGMMRFVGSDDLTFSANVTNTSGSSAGARRIQVDAGTVTFGGSLFLASVSTNGFNLQLTGPGDLTLDGVVANYDGVGGTAGGVIHAGTGTLTLSNDANTYTGATSFRMGGSGTGVIVATKLADGGQPSSIGASSNAAENLVTTINTSTGVLRYIGSGDSTDRLFSILGTTLRFVIESSGTGALHFTNTDAMVTSGSGAKTLELGGNYTGSANTMAVEVQSDSGALSLVKSGAGTWDLTNTNGYGGVTTVNGGTLRVSGTGSINSSSSVTVNGSGSTFAYTSSVGLDRNVTVDSGGAFVHGGSTNYSGTFTWTDGILGGTNWNGNLNNLTVNANRTISPGNSPGTASTGNQTWGEGGFYIWEINNATGAAGADPGWDLVSGTGTLTISASVGNPFTIYVTSLTLGNDAGNAANFNPGTNYQWLIADFVDPVVGFNADLFAIDISGFSNATLPGSEFAIVLGDMVFGGDDSQIYLTYAIPEPGATALLVGVAGLVFLVLRRRK